VVELGVTSLSFKLALAASVVLAELDAPGTTKIDVVLFPKVHLGDPPSPHQHIR
jgi:hypothetical protein